MPEQVEKQFEGKVGMTVGDLKKLLADFPDDYRVLIGLPWMGVKAATDFQYYPPDDCVRIRNW